MPEVQRESDVLLAAAGDRQAFDRVYAAYFRMVLSLVRKAVREEDAEDLAQDIFFRAWQRLRSFRGDAAFGTWLHRLATNAIADHYRSRRPWHLPTGETAFMNLSISAQPRIELWDVHRALADLPAKMQAPAVLYYLQGFRVVEIAERLGLPDGTAKSRLSEARHSLRKQLACRDLRMGYRGARKRAAKRTVPAQRASHDRVRNARANALPTRPPAGAQSSM